MLNSLFENECRRSVAGKNASHQFAVDWDDRGQHYTGMIIHDLVGRSAARNALSWLWILVLIFHA